METAPAWHADSMPNQTVKASEDALGTISNDFKEDVKVMADELRRTKVGDAKHFLLRGASKPANPRWHGTSWNGLVGILTGGWLPSWGAGRAEALDKFGVDLPVVYTSPEYDTALWYPHAMVDATRKRVGERFAADAHPMRIVLCCDADVNTKRIQIRRRRGNKQDAWLPKDLQVWGVFFQMMSDAAPFTDEEPEIDSEKLSERGGVLGRTRR